MMKIRVIKYRKCKSHIFKEIQKYRWVEVGRAEHYWDSKPAAATVQITVIPLTHMVSTSQCSVTYRLWRVCRKKWHVFNLKQGGKNHRKNWIWDLIGIEVKYYASDSSVNWFWLEASDELVLASLTSKHGGFYIHLRMLQLWQTSKSNYDFIKENKKNYQRSWRKLVRREKKEKRWHFQHGEEMNRAQVFPNWLQSSQCW